eukprot:TRINITY_DN8611_c0_g1_i1.p1 TRINITY_DN8611_c0_g1~~TRINITY_DN8611_c0_g1_i1.p1  ORF type:complete len:215 (+),score=27.43 TRINITY_DN8611_c0_g1_i1:30-674(+)
MPSNILFKTKFSSNRSCLSKAKEYRNERWGLKLNLFPIHVKLNKKATMLSKRFQKMCSEQINGSTKELSKNESFLSLIRKKGLTAGSNQLKTFAWKMSKQDLGIELRNTQRGSEEVYWRKRGKSYYRAEEDVKFHKKNILLNREKRKHSSFSYYLKELLISTADKFVRDKFKKYKESNKPHLTRNARILGSLSLIHICRCRRYAVCRSRWSPYH